MNPEVVCKTCKCPCHCDFEYHSTWGGPPSQFSGECDCDKCECDKEGE